MSERAKPPKDGEKEKPLAPVPDEERQRRLAELDRRLSPQEERERVRDDEPG